MKILFLTDDFPPYSFGGAGIVAYNLVKEFKARGHEIFIITTTREKLNKKEIEFDGLKIFKIYTKYHERWRAWLSLYNPQTIPEIKKIIKKIKPDIVHAHNVHCYLSYYSFKIAKKYAKAVFLTTHDAMIVHYGKVFPKKGTCFYKISILDQVKEARKRYNPFRNITIRHYLKHVDKIFAVSNALKKLLEINGIKNIEIIYNGIDVDDWRIDLEKVERFKEKHSLQNKKIVLFGGRLSNAKGGEVILKSMAKTIKSIKDVVLLVAGEKDLYAEKMIKLARRLKISGNIRFTGWLNRKAMKCAFFASDICVTPSIYLDPFNLFNIEAAATRKSVVGTCFGGTPEIILNNKMGYIVDPCNTKELSEKIIDLLKNPERAKQFGEVGYQRIKENFSIDKQVEKTLYWYKKFLKNE